MPTPYFPSSSVPSLLPPQKMGFSAMAARGPKLSEGVSVDWCFEMTAHKSALELASVVLGSCNFLVFKSWSCNYLQSSCTLEKWSSGTISSISRGGAQDTGATNRSSNSTEVPPTRSLISFQSPVYNEEESTDAIFLRWFGKFILAWRQKHFIWWSRLREVCPSHPGGID